MAKKNRLRMHCTLCNKNTVHEVRTVDGQESCICLICEANPGPIGDPAQRDLRRYEAKKFKTQNEIERERMRMWFPG